MSTNNLQTLLSLITNKMADGSKPTITRSRSASSTNLIKKLNSNKASPRKKRPPRIRKRRSKNKQKSLKYVHTANKSIANKSVPKRPRSQSCHNTPRGNKSLTTKSWTHSTLLSYDQLSLPELYPDISTSDSALDSPPINVKDEFKQFMIDSVQSHFNNLPHTKVIRQPLEKSDILLLLGIPSFLSFYIKNKDNILLWDYIDSQIQILAGFPQARQYTFDLI